MPFEGPWCKCGGVAGYLQDRWYRTGRTLSQDLGRGSFRVYFGNKAPLSGVGYRRASGQLVVKIRFAIGREVRN